jgi:hypothetical protein
MCMETLLGSSRADTSCCIRFYISCYRKSSAIKQSEFFLGKMYASSAV